MTSPTPDPRVVELVRLSRALVERDGKRLFRALNSPAIAVMEFNDHKLWIKRVRGRLYITLSYPTNARTCIYEDGPHEVEWFISPTWTPDLAPFLDGLRRRLVLDAMLG